jgi:hypothetical protein
MGDIPTPDPLDPMTPGTLAWAIEQWQRAADAFTQEGNPATARLCATTAHALESERDTGVAVCPCCGRPVGTHH